MSIFANAIQLSLPQDPVSLIEGQTTSTISSGITYGSDPALFVRNTVTNVSNVNQTTAATISPNFDRFSVFQYPQAYGVTGNLFQSGQDLVPISQIAGNFGGTFIGDELSQINVTNLLQNPGQELSTFARNLSNSVANQARQQGNSAARSVVQDLKDIFRGAVNSVLDPNAAKTTNLGVTDSRLSYAFFGPIDANKKYSKGITEWTKPTPPLRPTPQPKPEGFQGVEPIINPHYVFRLNTVANAMSAGQDSSAQSRLLLDKEFRMGVSKIGKKEVTLSALLNRFGNFSQSNPTPYRAADFLWLKYYNIMPLTRLITLRRYMFPIQDNLTRSPYFGSGNRGGSLKTKGWSNNPISQMVTYFGGSTGNDLSTILKVSVSTSYETISSEIQDVKFNNGAPLDVLTMFDSSRIAKLATSATTNIAAIPFLTSNIASSLANAKSGNFFQAISGAAKRSNITQTDLAAGLLALGGVIDKNRFAGIAQFQDVFNPYQQGGYLSDLYREPVNRVYSTLKRKPGLSGGMWGDTQIILNFDYSLKSIGHINAKAAMLDIMANILATTHYRGTFWGGEARFYLNKGLFPLLDENQTIQFVKMIWSGDLDGAVNTFTGIIKDAFGGKYDLTQIYTALLSLRDANTTSPTQPGDTGRTVAGSAGTAETTQNSSFMAGLIPDKLKEFAAIDLLAGLFGLTNGMGNPSIPQFQALKTGAPIGEWHLTVGNPFKPIAVIGNLVCEGVEITFGDELGPDDFPTEMRAAVKLRPGMPRANQDIESVFNDGFGALYLPKPDLFDSNKALEEVQEELSKQVNREQLFDFMDFLPDSTVESLSNFSRIQSNTDVSLPSPHIARPDPPNIK